MRFIFATLQQAQDLMGTSDEYSKSLNAYNLDWANGAKTESEFLENCKKSCQEWTEKEKNRAMTKIAQFQSILMDLDLEINEEIVLIKTNGSDCNFLPYTRKNFIVFPQSTIKEKEDLKEEKQTPLEVFSLGLLIHESFHIISRNNEGLRHSLYPFFGFEYQVDFKQEKYFPPQMVINPDAPRHDHVIRVKHEDREYLGTPVFEGFGKTLKLLLFDEAGVFKRIVKHNKTNYLKQIKAASGYTIHPEEIGAEFFRVSLTDKEPLDSNVTKTFLALLKAYFKGRRSGEPHSNTLR